MRMRTAIAAGVAAVALVSLRIAPINAPANNVAAAAIETPSMPVLVDTGIRVQERLPSDTVPASSGTFTAPPPIQVINNGRLANFVMAHSEYSTPLGRRNVLTGLLAEEAIEQNSVDAASEPMQRSDQDDSKKKSSRGIATR